LGDEINRTPPKTQAALLEAMQERRVTIDGTSHDLGAGFMVVATQNPVEQQGTYPLPEAQLDRFLFKYIFDYPSREEELSIVSRFGTFTAMPNLDDLGLKPVGDLATLESCRELIAQVRLNEEMIGYIVDIIRATREDPALEFGASPRSASMLALAGRAHAALQGRDYVIPDDIKAIAEPALAHRVVLAPGAEIEGVSSASVIKDILDQVAAPR
jgi:MoxR-like ATPase